MATNLPDSAHRDALVPVIHISRETGPAEGRVASCTVHHITAHILLNGIRTRWTLLGHHSHVGRFEQEGLQVMQHALKHGTKPTGVSKSASERGMSQG